MSVFERESGQFFHTYKRLKIEVDRGEGAYLIAKDGTRYLDMFGGIAVNALGYNHPKINAAIIDQLHRFIHVSNTFYQDTQIELAELLLNASGLSRIFLTNSGTEAMEGALKLCRMWGTAFGKVNIFGLSDSFHGRTLGSLSITGREKYREGFGPFLPNTGVLKFNDVSELERNVNESTLAVVLECIQGEGGINLVSEEYVRTLKELRSRFGFLIVADEIQSGVGRTGRLFACEHFNLEPDIVVLAKAIGGGLPLGAFLGVEKLANVFAPGMHGTTFGGNPVACAAGIATVREVLNGGLIDNAATMGEYLIGRLNEFKVLMPDLIREVRGKGLMVGMELTIDGTDLINTLLIKGILLNLTNTNVIRWLPPLNVTREHLDLALDAVLSALSEIRGIGKNVIAVSTATSL
jgi:predicted acetylornithine/succinylornithine family transaminase